MCTALIKKIEHKKHTCYICTTSVMHYGLRYLLFGKFMFIKLCRWCLQKKWDEKTCEDCGEKKPNDLFKTICDHCLSIKSNELHYCASYLDYNIDITKVIINQLDEIKNYLIIKN
jgi:hypothetical protein